MHRIHKYMSILWLLDFTATCKVNHSRDFVSQTLKPSNNILVLYIMYLIIPLHTLRANLNILSFCKLGSRVYHLITSIGFSCIFVYHRLTFLVSLYIIDSLFLFLCIPQINDFSYIFFLYLKFCFLVLAYSVMSATMRPSPGRLAYVRRSSGGRAQIDSYHLRATCEDYSVYVGESGRLKCASANSVKEKKGVCSVFSYTVLSK